MFIGSDEALCTVAKTILGAEPRIYGTLVLKYAMLSHSFTLTNPVEIHMKPIAVSVLSVLSRNDKRRKVNLHFLI